MPRIQLRRDTAANWTSANPTLAAGEMGVETDTRRIKIGNDSSAWNSLAYLDAGPPQVVATGGGAIADLTAGQQAVITTGTIVTTTDGRRWIYSGTGSKTSEASYVELADVTPTWDSIASKPSTFTPASHPHGNITNAGAIGSTANLPLITTTSGVVTTGSFGTSANTFCQGNDARLSDARTPTSHTHAISDVTSLQTTLDGKAASSHTHVISDVTGLQTALDGAALNSTSVVICKEGDDIAAKYAAAAALTPNGAAKTTTNRATLIVFPGSYSVGAATLNASANYVDIIGLGSIKLRHGAIPAVTVTSTNVTAISVTASDVRIKGLSAGTKRFSTNGNANQKFEDCTGGYNSFSSSTVAGSFINCAAGAESFGYANTGVVGSFFRCIAGERSFGGATTDLYGSSFANLTVSGVFVDCVAGHYSFGGASPRTDVWYGGTAADATGTFINCSSGTNSFGGGNTGAYVGSRSGSATGDFKNCTAGAASFGCYGTTAGGLFEYCTADGAGFGAFGTAAGVCIVCRVTSGAFQTLTAPGKYRLCLDGSFNIVSEG